MFLKVYTHPIKVAAGAMLGKALYEAAGRPGDVAGLEKKIERLGDGGVLAYLRNSRDKACRELAKALVDRQLYEPIYGTRLLDENDVSEAAYESKARSLDVQQIFTPMGRQKLERTIAESARLDHSKVIIYCARQCPGFQKISQYVERAGKVMLRGAENKTYRRVRERHLALWWAYAFVAPGTENRAKAAVESEVGGIFGRPNEISIDRRQGVLFM